MVSKKISNGAKAIVLLSGGLDSTLAAKVVQKQGIELKAVNYHTIFCPCNAEHKSCLSTHKAAQELNIPLKVFEVSPEFIEMVKHPQHGYGKNLNPCIDCRIFMLKKASEYMKRSGASFLVTGEVMGERPMSQRKNTMQMIDRETALTGLILRPLSAKLLEPTIPEKQGLIKREKLFEISGRSRKPQMELAKKYNITNYPNPAGGCLLTDPGFTRRLRDLMKYKPDFNLEDVKLLKIGRHLRISDQAKLVIGRDEEDNKKLSGLIQDNDIVIDAQSAHGPLALIRGNIKDSEIEHAAAITAGYSKGRNLPKVNVFIRTGKTVNPDPTEVTPVPIDSLVKV